MTPASRRKKRRFCFERRPRSLVNLLTFQYSSRGLVEGEYRQSSARLAADDAVYKGKNHGSATVFIPLSIHKEMKAAKMLLCLPAKGKT